MEFKIEYVKARQILDSRGNPTIEVEVKTKNAIGIASAPSGKSRGKNEAVELRGGKSFHGKSVEPAIENVNKIISHALIGMDVREQEEIDKKMIAIDGTKNKALLGANACIATSMAVSRCAANALKKPLYLYLNEKAKLLPIPFMNVINGGVHAGNELAIQEHLIAPVKAKSFRNAVEMACETYYSLKEIISSKYGKNATNVGDEGGFAPPLKDSFDALETMMKAVEENGYENEIMLAIDSAASNFYKNGHYFLNKKMDSGELIDYYVEMSKVYPIISIEDGFHEEDWEAFVKLTERIGGKVQIVGDDLYVTNINRLKRGVEMGATNSILIKLNQIGTVTETLETIEYAKTRGLTCIISHRSGETEDTFIADLAVGTNAGMIKTGSLSRSERIAKYNRLLRIEEELENVGEFRGLGSFYSIKR